MEPTIAIAGIVGLLATSKKFIDFLRFVMNLPATKSEVLTQLCSWGGGTIAVFLYGASQLGDFEIPGTGLTVSNMNGWTKLLVGVSIGSGASLITDWIKARDDTDSAKVPPLLPPS